MGGDLHSLLTMSGLSAMLCLFNLCGLPGGVEWNVDEARGCSNSCAFRNAMWLDWCDSGMLGMDSHS